MAVMKFKGPQTQALDNDGVYASDSRDRSVVFSSVVLITLEEFQVEYKDGVNFCSGLKGNNDRCPCSALKERENLCSRR